MARTTTSAISGKFRARKGGDVRGEDEVLTDAACASSKAPGPLQQRRLLAVLAVLQALCLLGFAHMAQHNGLFGREETPAARVLTDETLPFFVAGNPNGTLLYFHASACGHCEALAPAFEAAARELRAHGGIPLAATALAPRAAERYGVRRVPTMLWFKQGQAVLELPPTARSTAKITEYVHWAMQPAIITFDTRDELEEAVPQLRAALHAGAPPVVVGFPARAGARAALEAAAERSRGKTVFLFVEEQREGDTLLRAYYQSPEKDQEYGGEVSPEAADAWVKSLLLRG